MDEGAGPAEPVADEAAGAGAAADDATKDETVITEEAIVVRLGWVRCC